MPPTKSCHFTVASGMNLHSDRVVTLLYIFCNTKHLVGDFFVRAVPEDPRLDWLAGHWMVWHFYFDKLRSYSIVDFVFYQSKEYKRQNSSRKEHGSGTHLGKPAGEIGVTDD